MSLTNTNKEKQLLGLALSFPDDADDILKLDESNIYNTTFRNMFKVFKEMYVEGDVDWSAYARKCGIESHNIIKLVQADNVVSGAQIPGLVKEIKDLSKRRSMVQAGYLLQQNAEDVTLDTNELLGKAARYIEDATVSEAKQPRKIIDIVEKLADNYLTGTYVKGIQTGLTDLDDLWAGLFPAELTIVAARPSMGKTAFAQLLAEKAAVHTQLPVPFFSLEMSEDDLVSRYMAADMGIDVDKLRRGMFNKQRLEDTYKQILERYARIPIQVQDESELTTFDIAAQCRQIKRREGLGAVFVDYLTLLSDDKDRGESEALKVSYMIRRLKSLSKSLNVPVIAVAQLNRRPEMRENKRPVMSDLTESGGIEAAAHNVLLLYRNEYYHTDKVDNTLEIIVAKQRQGPRGVTAKVFYEAKAGKFGDLSVRGDEENETVWAGGKQ